MTCNYKKRSCIYVVAVVVALLFFLDPYIRQSVFGPTILREPLCYWERRIRLRIDPRAPDGSLTIRAIEWLAFDGGVAEPLDGDPSLLPVYLNLIDDHDVRVRRTAASGLTMMPSSPETDALILELLNDTDAGVRSSTARGIAHHRVHFTQAWPRLVNLLNDPDSDVRQSARWAINVIADTQPGFVAPIGRQP